MGADSTTFQLAELRLFTSPRALCDVNCDGVVTVSDVTSLLNHLAIAVEYDAHYDMNGDSAVTVSDVTALLNYLATA